MFLSLTPLVSQVHGNAILSEHGVSGNGGNVFPFCVRLAWLVFVTRSSSVSPFSSFPRLTLDAFVHLYHNMHSTGSTASKVCASGSTPRLRCRRWSMLSATKSSRQTRCVSAMPVQYLADPTPRCLQIFAFSFTTSEKTIETFTCTVGNIYALTAEAMAGLWRTVCMAAHPRTHSHSRFVSLCRRRHEHGADRAYGRHRRYGRFCFTRGFFLSSFSNNRK